MADLARALQTPVPATQPVPQQPQPAEPVPMGRGEKAAITRENNEAKAAKAERDRLRRKAKRAADLKAAQEAAAKPKRKAKKKAAYRASDRAVMKQLPKLVAKKKVRGRGRPPGSKNKPKVPSLDRAIEAAFQAPAAFVTLAAPLGGRPAGDTTPVSATLAIIVTLARMGDAQRMETLAAINAAFA